MYIKELDIKSFGNLENKKISFSSGFNMIYGPNESGKTTMVSFVLFMFYGTKIRKGNNKIFFKDRYMPWNGKALDGQVLFETDGMEYILRRFCSPERSFVTLYCQTTGENIKDARILKSPGEYYFGLNPDTFLKTTYFSSISAEINSDNSDEIITKLRNLYETAATEMSYNKISSEIENEIAYLSSEKRKNSKIPQLRSQINALETEVLKAEKHQNDIVILKNKIEDNNKRMEKLNSDLAQIETAYKEESALNQTKNDNPKNIPYKYLALIFIISLCVYAYNMHIGLFIIALGCVFLFLYIAIKEKKPRNKIKHFTISRNDDKIKMILDEISELRVNNAVSKEQINTLSQTDVFQLKSRLSVLHKELSIKLQRLDALKLASLALQLGYNDMKTVFSPKLSKVAGDFLSLLTGGKYSSVLVDDKFEISVESPEGYNLASHLSRATLEQTYLALRLALVTLICSNKNTPLILDDAFAFYDSGRREYAFDCIMTMSADRQIIFTTCRQEEYDCLSSKHKINIITFPV